MLKFLFWILLLANAGLAAYQLGYLDTLLPNGHEPTRVQRQIEPQRLRVVPEPKPEHPPASGAAEPAPEVVAVAAAAPAQVCLEVGSFNQEQAQRFVAQLGDLASRAQRRALQEVASHMVYMPPQPDRAGAERKAAELRALGIEDFFIIQDNSSLRWGISLGVFKTEEGARTHLAELNRKGVRSARIGQRTATSSQVAFRFADLDPAARAVVEQAKAGFERQTVRECAPA